MQRSETPRREIIQTISSPLVSFVSLFFSRNPHLCTLHHAQFVKLSGPLFCRSHSLVGRRNSREAIVVWGQTKRNQRKKMGDGRGRRKKRAPHSHNHCMSQLHLLHALPKRERRQATASHRGREERGGKENAHPQFCVNCQFKFTFTREGQTPDMTRTAPPHRRVQNI